MDFSQKLVCCFLWGNYTSNITDIARPDALPY